MYNEFKLIDSEHIGAHIELYRNTYLFVWVDFHKDEIRIAKRVDFDRWSNADITTCRVPYTREDYVSFEALLIELCGNQSSDIPHKKLTFI